MNGDTEEKRRENPIAFTKAEVDRIVDTKLQQQRIEFIENRMLSHADNEEQVFRDIHLALQKVESSVQGVKDQFPKEREYFYSKFMTKSEGDELERRLESKIDGIRQRIVWTLGGFIALATVAQFVASLFLQARAIVGG